LTPGFAWPPAWSVQNVHVPKGRPTPRAWWWLVPLLLLTCWLGARKLNDHDIWSDEYHSIADAGGLYAGPQLAIDIWQRLEKRNPWHTPGYFLTLSVWGRLVGWKPALLAVAIPACSDCSPSPGRTVWAGTGFRRAWACLPPSS